MKHQTGFKKLFFKLTSLKLQTKTLKQIDCEPNRNIEIKLKSSDKLTCVKISVVQLVIDSYIYSLWIKFSVCV